MEKRGRAAALTVRIGPLALALLPLALFACGEDEEPAQGKSKAPGQFGSELAGVEARRAVATLRGYLDARAQGRWARACSYLTASTRDLVEQAASSERISGTDCPSYIAASSEKLLPAQRAALERAIVGSVRGDGERGHVLYQVPGDGERAMPIRATEGGSWKLAALSGTPVPTSSTGGTERTTRKAER